MLSGDLPEWQGLFPPQPGLGRVRSSHLEPSLGVGKQRCLHILDSSQHCLCGEQARSSNMLSPPSPPQSPTQADSQAPSTQPGLLRRCLGLADGDRADSVTWEKEAWHEPSTAGKLQAETAAPSSGTYKWFC